MPTLSQMDELVDLNDGAEEEQIDNGLVALENEIAVDIQRVALTLE